VDHISALVQVGEVQTNHQFVVVNRLVAPVILGVDFLQENGLVLDFSLPQVEVRKNAQGNQKRETIDGRSGRRYMERPSRKRPEFVPLLPLILQVMLLMNVVYPNLDSFEYPESTVPGFKAVVEEFKDLFHTSPGVTFEAQHYIPTSGNLVRVPPRRIPAHYHDKVEQQIQEMLDLGVIEDSSSPWMAPAVFVKKSGEIPFCVDYCELNKKTTKDASGVLSVTPSTLYTHTCSGWRWATSATSPGTSTRALHVHGTQYHVTPNFRGGIIFIIRASTDVCGI